MWGDGNKFSGNEAADLGCNKEEAAPAGGQPAQPLAEAPLPATPADADLLRELECVVCKDVMLRPFSVCHLGHVSACMSCYKQLKVCPLCRGKLLSPPTRLLPLEGLAKNVLVPCTHAADGCPLVALRYADVGAHAAKCDWRKVTRSLAALHCDHPYSLLTLGRLKPMMPQFHRSACEYLLE